MNGVKSIIALVGVMGLIFSQVGWAEEKGVTKLEEIVVMATRTEKEAASAPGSVSGIKLLQLSPKRVDMDIIIF